MPFIILYLKFFRITGLGTTGSLKTLWDPIQSCECLLPRTVCDPDDPFMFLGQTCTVRQKKSFPHPQFILFYLFIYFLIFYWYQQKPDKHNITPLLASIYESQTACVKLLLEKVRKQVSHMKSRVTQTIGEKMIH